MAPFHLKHPRARNISLDRGTFSLFLDNVIFFFLIVSVMHLSSGRETTFMGSEMEESQRGTPTKARPSNLVQTK